MDKKCRYLGCTAIPKFACRQDNSKTFCDYHIRTYLQESGLNEKIPLKEFSLTSTSSIAMTEIGNISTLMSDLILTGKDMFQEICQKLCQITDNLVQRQKDLCEIAYCKTDSEISIDKIQRLGETSFKLRTREDFAKLVDLHFSKNEFNADFSVFKDDLKTIMESLQLSNRYMNQLKEEAKNDKDTKEEIVKRLQYIENKNIDIQKTYEENIKKLSLEMKQKEKEKDYAEAKDLNKVYEKLRNFEDQLKNNSSLVSQINNKCINLARQGEVNIKSRKDEENKSLEFFVEINNNVDGKLENFERNFQTRINDLNVIWNQRQEELRNFEVEIKDILNQRIKTDEKYFLGIKASIEEKIRADNDQFNRINNKIIQSANENANAEKNAKMSVSKKKYIKKNEIHVQDDKNESLESRNNIDKIFKEKFYNLEKRYEEFTENINKSWDERGVKISNFENDIETNFKSKLNNFEEKYFKIKIDIEEKFKIEYEQINKMKAEINQKIKSEEEKFQNIKKDTVFKVEDNIKTLNKNFKALEKEIFTIIEKQKQEGQKEALKTKNELISLIENNKKELELYICEISKERWEEAYQDKSDLIQLGKDIKIDCMNQIKIHKDTCDSYKIAMNEVLKKSKIRIESSEKMCSRNTDKAYAHFEKSLKIINDNIKSSRNTDKAYAHFEKSIKSINDNIKCDFEYIFKWIRKQFENIGLNFDQLSKDLSFNEFKLQESIRENQMNIEREKNAAFNKTPLCKKKVYIESLNLEGFRDQFIINQDIEIKYIRLSYDGLFVFICKDY